MKFKISFKFIKKFFVHSLAFFILASCTETTFLINSAKRMGSWGDDPIYKVGNPYKINGNGIILLLTMITMKLEWHLGMVLVFMEKNC